MRATASPSMPTPAPAQSRDFTLDILCKDAPGVLQVRSPRRAAVAVAPIFIYSSNALLRTSSKASGVRLRIGRDIFPGRFPTDARPPRSAFAQKISATVTAAGFNIGTIATSPCPEHATLGYITVSLADALFARPKARRAAKKQKKKMRK
jgi:hypothetical protein